MAKNGDIIEVEGVVLKELPGAEYIVEINGSAQVKGYLGGKMRRYYIKIIPGDIVRVELSPYDLTRGRIVYRQTNTKKRGSDSSSDTTQKQSETPNAA